MEKRILCYGDSNTWGYVAGSRDYETMYVERYDSKTRWPTLLQRKLGDSFHIIEEGLNGRTTNVDDPFPPDRNGKTYLLPCLYTHSPLDLVILALGGNDFKRSFERKPADVRDGLADLIAVIQGTTYGTDMVSPPKILVVSQFIPLPISETFLDEAGAPYLEDIVAKANALVPLYGELAKQTRCDFLDVTNDIMPSSVDGMHLDEVGHAEMARLIHDKITGIFLSTRIGGR